MTKKRKLENVTFEQKVSIIQHDLFSFSDLFACNFLDIYISFLLRGNSSREKEISIFQEH